MSPITTHVLDLASGRPAADIAVELHRVEPDARDYLVGQGRTDREGRVRKLLSDGATLLPGAYRLTFDTLAYFTAQSQTAFYPTVQVTFQVTDPAAHYHVPLLLSPFGYSTYRGS
jgi:5-hydroxyisourate hydrolase